jgi:FkbM family methyltransferase
MMDPFTRFQRIFRSTLKHKTYYWSKRLVEAGYWPDDFELNSKHLAIPGIGFRINKEADISLLKARYHLERLAKNTGTNFTLLSNEHIITFEDIKAILQVPADVHQFEEIFLRHSKAVTMPKNSVVWDIGANVGFSALYFARHPNVAAVYAYEPFPETFKQLQKNLELNEHLTIKIKCFKFGIEAEAGTADVFYTRTDSEALSIYLDATDLSSPGRVSERIELVGAAQTLTHIKSLHPGQPVVIKLDCEGSEHTIIPALVEAGVLDNVPVITMETHFEDQSGIVKALESAGYTVFSSLNGIKTYGDIHACKRIVLPF